MDRWLDRINSPRDLKKMGWPQLDQLAAEIREEIIQTVSQTGGHLAPNLGVVELTMALHMVFKLPKDQIVWDVGHQCYVHKLLTGRAGKFRSLRQHGGISGFPNPRESDCDQFIVGHASTSISTALGLALARDHKGGKQSVVAVIGDGAMTGGLAFEALNHAGHLKTNLIVVLNDNEMSIAKNVGGLSAYLNRLRTDPLYTHGKDEVEILLKRIPAIGTKVLRLAERLKDSLKYLIVPGKFFEELGFFYIGPVDGHNLQELVEVFKRVKGLSGPVLVHALTQKGRGYLPAESDPDKFHGPGPFDIQSGEILRSKAKPTYTEIFGRTMVELAQKDERIIAITAAMASGTGLKEFARLFPQRFYDVGIAEEHAVTLAAGLARGGMRPVVAIYSTFLQRALDQIMHDVCLNNLPIVFAVDRCGIVGEDGPTHHGLFEQSFLRTLPGLISMAPADENELRHMLVTALAQNGPSVIRYPRGSGTGAALEDQPQVLPVGKARILRRGNDVVLLALGSMVSPALKAAEILNTEGIRATVANARFIKPLDVETIVSLSSTAKLLVTIEEHVLSSGFGSSVLETLQQHKINNVAVERIGIGDTFVEHGNQEILRELHGLTAQKIADCVKKSLIDHNGQRKKLRMV